MGGRGRRGGMGWRVRTRSISALAHSALPALPALLFLLALATAHAQEPATFRASSSELVVLPVVVTQPNGTYVSDLTADHFTVYDNARPQAVSLFSSEDTPVSVAVVVDA